MKRLLLSLLITSGMQAEYYSFTTYSLGNTTYMQDNSGNSYQITDLTPSISTYNPSYTYTNSYAQQFFTQTASGIPACYLR